VRARSVVLRYLPNLITLVRLALIWPVAVGLPAGKYKTALACFIIAGLSDGLDGYLAKRFGWTSELGKVLDPSADKLLLMTVFIQCAWLGFVPWWLAVAAVARDVMIGGGAMLFRALIGPLHGRPTVISKINTLAQLASLTSVLVLKAADIDLSRTLAGLPVRALLEALFVGTLITTLLSGADYLITFTRRARRSPARHTS
jgi:cardiolipin synthase